MRRVSAPGSRVAVIGAGRSALVADLLATGDRDVVAVDVSSVALEGLTGDLDAAGIDRRRLDLVVADVRRLLIAPPVDVWHDRATFHFLTAPADQEAYSRAAAASVAPGGHLVLAGFSADGPLRCSGLDVARHTVDDLTRVFAPSFELTESFEHDHVTPSGAPQRFTYAVFVRSARPPSP